MGYFRTCKNETIAKEVVNIEGRNILMINSLLFCLAKIPPSNFKALIQIHNLNKIHKQF